MRLRADLHTHTIASGHAYSTFNELAQAAAAEGIELIAVCDHGPALPGAPHEWHFGNLKNVPSVLDGVRVLKGVEANPQLDTENGLDLPDAVLHKLDFVAVGFHPCTGFDEPDRARNTELLMRIMASGNVDMITHPGNEMQFPLDLDDVVAAAVEHRVILELNNYTFSPMTIRNESAGRERAFAEAALAAGAPIAINSDAHHAARVGRFEDGLEVARELGITEDRVVNRSAAAVLEFLLARRERPRLDVGGAWDSPSVCELGSGESASEAG